MTDVKTENTYLDGKTILYNCPLLPKEKKINFVTFQLLQVLNTHNRTRCFIWSTLLVYLEGAIFQKSNKPEPAAWENPAFWTGVSGRETKHSSVVRPPSALEFSTFTNQPAWEGPKPHTDNCRVCKETSLPLWDWKTALIQSWAVLMGKGRPHHLLGSASDPFQPNTPQHRVILYVTHRDNRWDPVATDCTALLQYKHISGNHTLTLQGLT